ncbi:MAG: hypothetical protein ACE5GO_04160 [Anaerolineales bacterium]
MGAICLGSSGGRVVGQRPAAQVVSCHTYGYNLGVLLQIADDWAGLESAPDRPCFISTVK